MESLKNLLPKAMVRHSITKQVKAATVCAAWENIASKILPEVVVAGVEVISFNFGTLKISVPGSNFHQAVKIQETQLRESFNKEFKGVIVERIKIVIEEKDETQTE